MVPVLGKSLRRTRHLFLFECAIQECELACEGCGRVSCNGCGIECIERGIQSVGHDTECGRSRDACMGAGATSTRERLLFGRASTQEQVLAKDGECTLCIGGAQHEGRCIAQQDGHDRAHVSQCCILWQTKAQIGAQVLRPLVQLAALQADEKSSERVGLEFR
jgi:hypothetical protein